MIKITSFSALIAGLLLLTPMMFSTAEAGAAAEPAASTLVKSDRLQPNRLDAAFTLFAPGTTTVDPR